MMFGSRLNKLGAAFKSRPSPQASFNFALANESLDSRITYSGDSARTYFDSTGTLRYAPMNLVTYSEQFDNAAWSVKTNVTLTPGVSDPFGGTAAFTMERTSGAATAVFGQVFIGMSGASYTGAFYVRSRSGSGTVGLYVGDNVIQTITITSEWQRFERTDVTSSTNVRCYISLNGAGTDTIDIYGASLNLGSTAFDYIPTTAAAVYLPRSNSYQDHDPSTLAPLGFLIEEQRTNLLTYSEQFDNAAWLKSNASISANSTTAPDGATTADSLIETATTATHYISVPSVAISAGQTATFSIYARKGARSTIQFVPNSAYFTVPTYVNFDLDAGTVSASGSGITSSIVDCGGGWYRCVVSIACTVTVAGVTAYWVIANSSTMSRFASYAGNGTDGVYIWGAQAEAGAFPTSYIPTTTAAATRLADVASVTGTNFSSWYNQSEGTIVAQFDTYSPTAARVFQAGDGTGNNRIDGLMAASNFAAFATVGGVSQVNGASPGTLAAGVIGNVALSYKLNDYAWLLNGGAVATDTSATVPSVDRLGLGYRFDAAGSINGHIQSITYYNKRLPNATLQSLTV